MEEVMFASPLALLLLSVAPGPLVVRPLEGDAPSVQRAEATAQLIVRLTEHHYPAMASDGQPPCGPTDLTCQMPQAIAQGGESLVQGSLSAQQLEVKVLRVTDGHVTASGHAEVTNGDLTGAVERVVQALLIAFEAPPAPMEPPAPPTLGARFWTPVISGAVVLAAGAFVFGTALVSLDQTRSAAAAMSITSSQAALQIDQGVRQRNLGIVGMSLGAASILAGIIFARPEPAPVALSPWVSGQGGGLVLTGHF
jgi:hypothetical protein